MRLFSILALAISAVGAAMACGIATSAAAASQASSAEEAPQVIGIRYRMPKMKRNLARGIYREVGGGVELYYADGWKLDGPEGAPDEIDVAASRASEPDRWSRWEEAELADLLEPLPRGATFDLAVHRPKTGSAGGSTSSSTRRLTLTEDGRFETSFFALAGGEMAEGSSTVGVAEDSKGRRGVGSGTASLGSAEISSVQRSRRDGNGRHSGRYLIDGNVIELTYDDGTVARLPFGTDGTSKIVMGDINYWVPKDAR